MPSQGGLTQEAHPAKGTILRGLAGKVPFPLADKENQNTRHFLMQPGPRSVAGIAALVASQDCF